MTAFFVPDFVGAPADHEARYHELARGAQSHPLPHGERILSIEWEHDREPIRAEVGKHLQTKPRGQSWWQNDAATVLAIFPADADHHFVVLDAPPLGTARTGWTTVARTQTSRVTELFATP